MSLNALLSDWEAHIRGAVSPLSDGVAPLEVKGPGTLIRPGRRPSRTAAVLVPVLRGDCPSIILTVRADDLPQHAGQVSFPGGRADEADHSAVETALREAREEIGLPEHVVTPLGFLDRFDVISDYRVLPIVGLIDGPVKFSLDPREVSDVFAVPIEVALDRKRYEAKAVKRNGVRYTLYSLEWEGRLIWGATAAMLMNFAGRVEHRLRGRIA